MEKKRYIQRMLRMAVLAVGMVLAGGASAWGQYTGYTVQSNSNQLPSDVVGFSYEVRYVIPNRDYTIQFQRGNLLDNVNGYIRWYRETNRGEDAEHLSNSADGNLREYANGFVWYGSSNAPSGTITYSSDMSSTEDIEELNCSYFALQHNYLIPHSNDSLYPLSSVYESPSVQRKHRV